MKSKIYFAKSNRANPNTVMKVRELLESHDVEVVEYRGGAFSHGPMLECDYLVILPEHDDCSYADDELPLGRGLHEQIHSWRHEKRTSDMFIVNTEDLDVWSFEDLEVCDYDDYVNHSVVLLSENLGTLSQILENRLGPATGKSISVSGNEYQYLLIGTN